MDKNKIVTACVLYGALQTTSDLLHATVHPDHAIIVDTCLGITIKTLHDQIVRKVDYASEIKDVFLSGLFDKMRFHIIDVCMQIEVPGSSTGTNIGSSTDYIWKLADIYLGLFLHFEDEYRENILSILRKDSLPNSPRHLIILPLRKHGGVLSLFRMTHLQDIVSKRNI